MNARLLVVALALVGQPDRRGEETTTLPQYKGVTASAPIPPDLHVQNEGGSNGAGLCVISSVLCNGQYQGVPGLVGEGKGSKLWITAKRRPGGYYPDKLAKLVEETVPGETYASYNDTDPALLDKLSRAGYPIGATMNTGAMYGYRPIHHMISLIHFRQGGTACVVDNNDPGKYHWMPAAEFQRRWIDGGTGWAWIWTRLPKAAKAAAWLAWLPVGLVVALVVLRSRQARLGAITAILGAVLFCPPAQAQGQVWAWHQVTANGQQLRVWGWIGTDGLVHYDPAQLRADKSAPAAPEPRLEGDEPGPDGQTNFGLDIEQIKATPAGTLVTNDPTFTPGPAGVPVDDALDLGTVQTAWSKSAAGTIAITGACLLVVIRATHQRKRRTA